jgi:hypothetical protein
MMVITKIHNKCFQIYFKFGQCHDNDLSDLGLFELTLFVALASVGVNNHICIDCPPPVRPPLLQGHFFIPEGVAL